jgi:hypothetical protein
MGVSMALYGDATVGRHVAPLGHVILVLATSPLTKKQRIPILFILVSPDRDSPYKVIKVNDAK